ncbi:MAG: acyl-CoA dehydrogenase family protein [Pseudomonadota bacterium]|nr:acyl-CoA dehydrogenase family protein [Pseudomonadota bacterium]GIT21201.1 MAG: acyl-CoA dehydrogenase [Gammaproteobacteria bacterium]
MDFSYSEVQLMLQDSVQKFVQKSYDHDTRTKIVDSEDGYSKENWQLFAELGWLAVPFTEEDGGLGGSAVDLIVMMEEFGKANLVEPFTATAVLGGGLIAELAEGAKKAELIEQLVTGSLQLACAYAESGSRFNLSKVTTTAAIEGGDVVINGNKIAVLNAPNADKILVVARESGAATDAEGVSIFLVDANAEGLAITPFTTFDGKKSSEVLFENVRVSESVRLGSSGQALNALQKVVDRATVGVSAEAVGALESLLKKTVEYSKTRKQFGTVIGTFQALQHRMADMFIECQLARSIVVMAAMQLDSSADELEKTKSVSAAKSRVGKAIRHVGQESIQIHGGIGMTDELDVGHLFKRVTAIDIMFGNADYHTERFAFLQ